MWLRRVLRISFGLVLLALMIVPTRAQEMTPKAFLETIYRNYSTTNSPGTRIDSKRALERYFTPPVVAMIEKDAKAAKAKGEPPGLNGDPFIDAQDWEVKNLKIAISHQGAAKASATVIFSNYGEDRSVRLNLVRTAAGWRIDDIRWRKGSLRGLYRGR